MMIISANNAFISYVTFFHSNGISAVKINVENLLHQAGSPNTCVTTTLSKLQLSSGLVKRGPPFFPFVIFA
jgi:hypothetical protein